MLLKKAIRRLGTASILFATSQAFAAGTAFTYQGQLKQTGIPINASVAMTFDLWDAATLGTQQGLTLTFDGVGGNPAPVIVSNGLFTAQLDFGVSPFAANLDRWLEITVNGQVLTPRQPLTAAPFALNTRGINVTSTGNVGIGTTAPGNKLEVTAASNGDGIRLTGATAPLRSPGFLLYDGATQRGTLGLAEGATAFSSDALAGDIVLRSNTGKLLLQTGAGAAAMAILANNVGIGTTAPEARLHVNDSSDVSPAGGGVIIVGPTSGLNIALDQNEIMARNNGGTASLTLNADGGIVVLGGPSGGNVGIGTTAPIAKLDVRGNVSTTGSITIPATTRVLSLSPYAFHPVRDGVDFYIAFVGTPGALFAGSTTDLQNMEFAASVNLPNGAVVTRFAATVYDDDPIFGITVELSSIFLDDGTGLQLASVATTGIATPGLTTVVDTTVASSTIDNTDKAYWVRASWVEPNSPSLDIRLGAVRIDYTITSPLP